MKRTISKKGLTALRDFGIPGTAAFLFLAIDSNSAMTELSLTAFIAAIVLLMFAVRSHKHEPWLFLTGVGVGAFVEIGLRVFGYQQVWARASLLGVPLWLPIAWGVGFVLITRLGIVIRGVRVRARE